MKLFLCRGEKLIVSIMLVCLSFGSVQASPGKELFEENCAACHGDEGTSILPGTPHFSKGERLEKSDEDLLKSIAKGLKIMPPWEGLLSEEEMKAALEYARRLVANVSR